MSPQLTSFQDQQEFEQAAVMLVGAIVSSNKSQTTIALSGGSTPKAIYALLAKQPVDFSNVTFYEVDERYVPRDHPNSLAYWY